MTAAAVLWDLDGTLVDSRVSIARSANVARTAVGAEPLPQAEIAAMVGDGMEALLQRLCPADGALDDLRAAFVAHYAEHCAEDVDPYPGIASTLAVLAAAGIAQAVVTNKPLDFSQRILACSGLEPFMGSVQGGDTARKPDPDQLLAACRELTVDPADCWMVGDHHTDLRAGRAAGCRVAFCAWGIGHPDGEAYDRRLERPVDLLAALEVAVP